MMRFLYPIFGLLSLVFLLPAPIWGQEPREIEALRRDILELKAGQWKLMKEMEEIKKLLRSLRAARPSRAPVQDVRFSIDIQGQPAKGDARSRIVLIEFSDYECPFCARHMAQTFPLLEKDYIRTGKIRYVLMDFPIERIHPRAFKAHEAANCANDQGKYWEFHDRIFTNRKAIGASDLASHAKALGLEMSKFNNCIKGGKYAAEIRKDISTGQRLGVRGTPSFFLGWVEPGGGKVQAVKMIRGAQPYFTFKKALDALLAKEK